MSDYSRGDYADLPAGTTDLENNYSAPDLTAIASNDNSTYAEQTAINEIAIHQYKKTVTGQYINITWSGKSSLAPSESPVIMEVYNVTGTPAWEELDRDDSTAADTDFDIIYNNLATADYLDSGVITWRVYQAASGVTYLLNDTFTTARAAGAVNGTASEPGPGGNRTVDSTAATISPAGTANLISAAQSTWYNWSYSALSRTLGQVLFANLTNAIVGGNASLIYIGMNSTNFESIGFSTNPAYIKIQDNGTLIDVLASSITNGQTGKIAIVQRAYGNFFFWMAPGSSNWVLLYFTDTTNQASLTPKYYWQNDTATSDYFQSDYMKIASSWWPVPLVSDAFGGSWGTTDGQGHYYNASGSVNSGEGVDGDGVTLTAFQGTFGITSGKAQPTVVNPWAFATFPTSAADIALKVSPYGADGTNGRGLILRYSDANNYLLVAQFPTTIKIYKYETGYTELVSGNFTYVDGAPLVVTAVGNDIRVYSNDTYVMTTSTSFNASATSHGIGSQSTTMALDNLSAYPIGTGGEYNTDLNNLLGE